MLVAGFLGGHMHSTRSFYHPAEVGEAALVDLPPLGVGLSSFGGFVGGLIGVITLEVLRGRARAAHAVLHALDGEAARDADADHAVLRSDPERLPGRLDRFGRSGCSVVHDHQGKYARRSGAWLAVEFGPDDPLKRIHLGPIEFRHGTTPHFGSWPPRDDVHRSSSRRCSPTTWRRKLTTGSYIAAVALAYSPVLLRHDFLRVKRHGKRRSALRATSHALRSGPAGRACSSSGLVMVAKIVAALRRTGQDPMELLT